MNTELENYLASASYDVVLPTKELIAKGVADAKEKLLNGELDYREVLIRKKVLTEALEALLKDEEVKKHMEEEQAKFGKKASYNGVEITYSGRKSWSYDKCGDPDYEFLKWKADAAANELKAKEKELQTLTKPYEKVHAETGEVHMIYPAAWTETNYFTISIPKK